MTEQAAHQVAIKQLLCNHVVADDQGLSHKVKRPIEGRAFIGFHGIVSPNGDKEYFEDADNAILHYAFDHYAYWRKKLPGAAYLLEEPGIFSENISSLGMTEENMCIGDILQCGQAKLQISYGRVACETMVERFHYKAMSKEMHASSKTGWFYRVLNEGHVSEGDSLSVLERPNPQWTVAKVQSYLFEGSMDKAVLEELVQLPYLASIWKDIFIKRIETGVLEKNYV